MYTDTSTRGGPSWRRPSVGQLGLAVHPEPVQTRVLGVAPVGGDPQLDGAQGPVAGGCREPLQGRAGGGVLETRQTTGGLAVLVNGLGKT